MILGKALMGLCAGALLAAVAWGETSVPGPPPLPPSEAQETAEPGAPTGPDEKIAASPAEPEGKAAYGKAIFEETSTLLRAAAEKDGGAYAGNALSCDSCHLDGGTRAGGLPLSRSFDRYPRYEAREGRVLSLEERIGACLQRCLNAPPLPSGSRELEALGAYLGWLSDTGEPPDAEGAFALPDRQADLLEGAEIYRTECQRCHGQDGGGSLLAGAPEGTAPAVPPLWGEASYGTGSGMHRLLVASAFIHGAMPPGATPADPKLTPEQAYDVAGFVNSFERPRTAGLERDYPALTEKPVDCPYPPFPDPYPAEQHKYGPFEPILAEWELYRQARTWVFWVPPERSEPLPLQARHRAPSPPDPPATER